MSADVPSKEAVKAGLLEKFNGNLWHVVISYDGKEVARKGYGYENFGVVLNNALRAAGVTGDTTQ